MSSGPLRRPAAVAVVAWVVSRLVTLAAALVAAGRHDRTLTQVLVSWDGTWYVRVIRDGYPQGIPEHGGHAVQSTIAFFPGYPLLVRAVDSILPGGDLTAAIWTNLALGLAATVVFSLLVAEHWGAAAGRRAGWVFACFPGALVLSMAYSEGLMLVAAAGCLLLLARKRWVLAGLAGAVATATRPSGIAVSAACAWVAVEAVRRRRAWRALAAPFLSVVGIAAYFAFLWRRTGSATAWLRVEHEGWGQTNDLGQGLIRQVVDVLGGRSRTIDDAVLAFGAVLTVVLFAWLVRLRPPAAVLVTGVVGTALIVTGILGARPRLVLGAFPLLIPPAVSLRGRWHAAWVAVSLVAGFALFVHLDANFVSSQPVLLSP